MLFLGSLILLFSCSSAELRAPASLEEIPSGQEKVDVAKSVVQFFPVLTDSREVPIYFFIQLKNARARFVDVNPTEIEVRSNSGKPVSGKLERLSAGRYYLFLDNLSQNPPGELDFYVQGRVMREQVKLKRERPDAAQSKLQVVGHEGHKIAFRLKLRDKKKRPVESPETPEIQLEGEASVEDMRYVGSGTWEFLVIYPETNQIIYVSVRAMGVFFPRLYRYQHVEK